MSDFQLSVLCLLVTLGLYFANKRLYRRFHKLPLMPLVLTPILLVMILVFGYALAIIFTVAGIAPMVDFSGIHKTIQEVGVFSIPKLVFLTSHKPVFNLGAFFTIAIVFLVSAAAPG